MKFRSFKSFSNAFYLISSMMLVSTHATFAQISILLDSFEATMMTPESLTGSANNTGTVRWKDLNQRWAGRNKDGDTADWQIAAGPSGRQLQCFDSDNRNTQCGAAYLVSFVGGEGWKLEFDAPFGAGWNDIDIWLGKNDGDNGAEDTVIDAPQSTLSANVINGDWVHLINNGWDGANTYSIDIKNHVTIDLDAEGNFPEDFVDYDLLVIRLQNSDLSFMAFDNFTLTSETEIEVSTGPISLGLSGNEGELTFEWKSRVGNVYDVLSSTQLDSDPSTWTPVISGSIATPPLNSAVIDLPADRAAFYVLRERPEPPLFTDDFEDDLGWLAGGVEEELPGTVWQRGAPTAPGGPVAANSGGNCFATNLAGDYTSNCEVWLRSPPISLVDPSIVGATLSFFQYRDVEAGFDAGSVRVVDAVTNLALGPNILSGTNGISTDWEERTRLFFPAAALGQLVRIEFRFTSDGQSVQSGWHIDDVTVEVQKN